MIWKKCCRNNAKFNNISKFNIFKRFASASCTSTTVSNGITLKCSCKKSSYFI